MYLSNNWKNSKKKINIKFTAKILYFTECTLYTQLSFLNIVLPVTNTTSQFFSYQIPPNAQKSTIIYTIWLLITRNFQF